MTVDVVGHTGWCTGGVTRVDRTRPTFQLGPSRVSEERCWEGVLLFENLTTFSLVSKTITFKNDNESYRFWH